jgi:hypothetical protein
MTHFITEATLDPRGGWLRGLLQCETTRTISLHVDCLHQATFYPQKLISGLSLNKMVHSLADDSVTNGRPDVTR